MPCPLSSLAEVFVSGQFVFKRFKMERQNKGECERERGGEVRDKGGRVSERKRERDRGREIERASCCLAAREKI